MSEYINMFISSSVREYLSEFMCVTEYDYVHLCQIFLCVYKLERFCVFEHIKI